MYVQDHLLLHSGLWSAFHTLFFLIHCISKILLNSHTFLWHQRFLIWDYAAVWSTTDGMLEIIILSTLLREEKQWGPKLLHVRNISFSSFWRPLFEERKIEFFWSVKWIFVREVLEHEVYSQNFKVMLRTMLLKSRSRL